MSFLFESVEGGAVRGRYSMIGLDPDLIWRTNGARAEINRNAERKPSAFAPCPQPPLEALRALIAESRIALPDDLPPMAAGVFGYLGYDMVRLMEELPASNPDPIGIPDAVLIRPTLVVVFDAVKDSITVVTPVRPEPGVTAKAALARARASGCRPWSMRSTGRSTRRPRRASPARSTSRRSPTPRPPNSAPWCRRPRTTSWPAIFSRWCCRSASRRRSRCRRSRSIARCAGSIRRRFCISSTSAASPSPDRARRCWCGCATAR